MLAVLADNLLLTMFLVIALGALFGAIPFGPVKFGAAGTLFIGLIAGALLPDIGYDLTIFQDLGLGLFVYMIGLEAGETFFKELKTQWGLMVTTVVAVALAAATALAAGFLLDMSRELIVGIFAGAVTNTPSLALAQEQTGSEVPAVGYAIGYPTGVIVAILVVAVAMSINWTGRKDQLDPDEEVLQKARVEITESTSVTQIREQSEGKVLAATVRRAGRTDVLGADDALEPGDIITVFGTKGSLRDAVGNIGHRVNRNIFRDRQVRTHQFIVSSRTVAGNTVGTLPLFDLYHAVITRIRRADEEFVPEEDTMIEMGDMVEIAYPINRHNELNEYFGDSIKTVSETDSVAAAGGLALGFLVALIEIPLPGGSSFALGAAAGPLLVGMVLGAIKRTKFTVWRLPKSVNYTIRQFGLMIFLAAVGLSSGPAFASTVFSMTGLQSIFVAALVGLIGCGSLFLLAWLQGFSATRAAGGVSGLLGQPAVLQFAQDRSSDSRITAGYGTTFAVALIAKILAVPVMFSV